MRFLDRPIVFVRAFLRLPGSWESSHQHCIYGTLFRFRGVPPIDAGCHESRKSRGSSGLLEDLPARGVHRLFHAVMLARSPYLIAAIRSRTGDLRENVSRST